MFELINNTEARIVIQDPRTSNSWARIYLLGLNRFMVIVQEKNGKN